MGAEQDLGDQIFRRPRFGAVFRLRQLHGRRVRKILAGAQGAGRVRFRRPDRGASGPAEKRSRTARAGAGAPAVGARRRISGRQRLAVSDDEAARRRFEQPDGRGRPRPVHLRLARRELRHDHELRARFPQRPGNVAGAELPFHRHDPRRLESTDPAQQKPSREKPAHKPGRRAESRRLVSARRKSGGRSAGAGDRRPHRGVSLRRHRRPLPHERPQPRARTGPDRGWHPVSHRARHQLLRPQGSPRRRRVYAPGRQPVGSRGPEPRRQPAGTRSWPEEPREARRLDAGKRQRRGGRRVGNRESEKRRPDRQSRRRRRAAGRPHADAAGAPAQPAAGARLDLERRWL